jgi:hypothetical protein
MSGLKTPRYELLAERSVRVLRASAGGKWACSGLFRCGADGSYSRGYVSASSLLTCVRADITEYLRSEFRDEVLGNITGMLQAIQAPDRLFEFECLAQLFARRLVPGQVLTRMGSAIFFSPARIISLGLP